tara:strand:- start:173 stop:484 length:312 start_codon:yes stop_codon:yes gene_type:complete
MSISKTILASGQIAVAASVVFGITVTSNINPASPPTGPLVVNLLDESSNLGAGPIQCRIIISDQGMAPTEQVLFPAGLRLLKGISIIAVANGHTDVTISVDYS